PQRPVKVHSTRNLERIRIDRLTVEDTPLDNLLKALAQQLKLELQMDRKAIEAAGVSLDQNVSLKVEKKVTIDELFRAALKSTGLSYRRHGNVVEITPAQ
ncbi:MAG: STN domain-containing protein, partial [Thermoguttaceae bacterium]